ncbi:MAG: hypothetical protein PUP90_30720 [Nostoc sp. S4]|nr:hypothetical protein [Nostoc sp. S4]
MAKRSISALNRDDYTVDAFIKEVVFENFRCAVPTRAYNISTLKKYFVNGIRYLCV